VEDITKGLVETVVCWRLDRLGKTCSELVKLFEYLSARSVNFISLKDHLDLSTVSGRRMAGVLGSITLYETEVRAQGILAGQEAARARGIRWGGSEKGRRVKVSLELEAKVKRLKVEGRKISHIARETGLSRPTIYKVLGEGSPSTCEERESGNRDNGGREIDERAATGDISPDGTDEPSDDADHFM
jgi:DNA invertase Pin-like site-specific DNA recombinase